MTFSKTEAARRALYFAALVLASMALLATSAAADGKRAAIVVSTTGNAVHARFDFKGPVAVSSFFLEYPPRLVIDVTGARLIGNPKTVKTDTARIHRVRVAQNSRAPDVVRIVFDLKSNFKPIVKIDEKAGVVEVTEKAATEQFPDLKIKKLSDRVEIIIPLKTVASYKTEHVVNPPRFVIDFENLVPRKPRMMYSVNEGIVKSARVSLFSREPEVTRLVVDTGLPAKIKLIEEDGGKKLIVKIYQPSLYKKIICIDPGHGGKDPGAQVVGSADEKNVVLDVARRLRDMLKDVGARVIMTRDSDVYVRLDDRSKIANQKRADVFLSIHVNALDNHKYRSSIRGIQTFHYKKNSRKFAVTMKDALAEMLATGDWGVFDRKYVVLMDTRMRATLVELGFLTHPDEFALLMDDTFRENAARGLYNGLERYLGGKGLSLSALELSREMVAHLPRQPFKYEYVTSGNVLKSNAKNGRSVSRNGERTPVINFPASLEVVPSHEEGLTHEVEPGEKTPASARGWKRPAGGSTE